MNNPIPTTATPCPIWCTMTRGHGWDTVDRAGEYRGHEHDFATVDGVGPDGCATVSVHVCLDAIESLTIDDAGAQTTLSVPEISIDSNSNGMTGSQARQVAAALLEAADVWDEVTS